MRKIGLAIAISLLGGAALAAAQDPGDDEVYSSIDERRGPWFLQRSTCTLAHNVNGDSIAVVRFRIGMGTEIEFLDPGLRRVRVGETETFVVTVDGAAEESLGMGMDEGDRQGYRLSLSHEMLERIGAGRRLEARTRGRTLLRLDLAGADQAVAALRACYDEAAAAPMEDVSNDMNAM